MMVIRIAADKSIVVHGYTKHLLAITAEEWRNRFVKSSFFRVQSNHPIQDGGRTIGQFQISGRHVHHQSEVLEVAHNCWCCPLGNRKYRHIVTPLNCRSDRFPGTDWVTLAKLRSVQVWRLQWVTRMQHLVMQQRGVVRPADRPFPIRTAIVLQGCADKRADWLVSLSTQYSFNPNMASGRKGANCSHCWQLLVYSIERPPLSVSATLVRMDGGVVLGLWCLVVVPSARKNKHPTVQSLTKWLT